MSIQGARILAVDDHVTMRHFYRMCLENEFHVAVASNGLEALNISKNERFDLYLVDLMMPGMDGVELIRKLKGIHENPQVIVVSQTEDIDTAVEAFKEQPVDFLRKPVQKSILLHAVRRNLKAQQARNTVRGLSEETAVDPRCPEPVLGRSNRMTEFWSSVRRIAESPLDVSVLIQGESGAGKEIVARQLHRWSKRQRRPFIPVNCGLLTPELAASELLGIEKGVATGVTSRPGKFLLADKGTLFLDEVAEIPLDVQPALLRVLQDGIVAPVGSRKEFNVDVRVIAATNKDIPSLVSKGRFREDLYYRLAVIVLEVPPLRMHREDIPDLLAHLYRRHGGRGDVPLSRDEIENWKAYDWPGNIRQLENMLLNRIILGKPVYFDPQASLPGHSPVLPGLNEWIQGKTLRQIKEAVFDIVLEKHGGNFRKAAQSLGISHSVLWKYAREKKKMPAGK